MFGAVTAIRRKLPTCRPYGTQEDGLLTALGYKHAAPTELKRKLFDLLILGTPASGRSKKHEQYRARLEKVT
jgi:hypothetical protein